MEYQYTHRSVWGSNRFIITYLAYRLNRITVTRSQGISPYSVTAPYEFRRVGCYSFVNDCILDLSLCQLLKFTI